MERVQSPTAATSADEVVPSLAPFPLVAEEGSTPPLERLALTARSTPGQAGREALHALHLALEGLGPSEPNAALLLRLLDEGAFNELRSDDGNLTRELAVETLLRLGYPWALQVHPDELAWYRASVFLRKRNKLMLLLAVLSAAGVIAAFLYRLF